MSRAYSLVFALLTALVAVPLWCAHYLPFTDLPEHVAAIATIAHIVRGVGPDTAIYEIAFGRCQYLLYHGLGGLLAAGIGDAILANRIVLTAVAVAFPFSVRTALRALGRDEALAFLAFLPFLSRPLFVGFLPYVASMPLYFFGIAFVARHAAAPSLQRDLGLAAWTLVLLFTHASTTVVFLVTAGVLEVLAAARTATSLSQWARASVRRSAWLAVGALALGAWWVGGKVTLRADSLAGPGEIGTMSFWRSVRALPLWSFDVFRPHLDELCGIFWWSALAVLAMLGKRTEREERPGLVGLVARIDPSFAPLIALVIAYVATPFRVGAGGMLNVRLAPLIALAAVLTIQRSGSRARHWVYGVAIVTTVVHVANASWMVRHLERTELAGLEEVLEAIPSGARVVSLQFDPHRSAVHIDPYPFVASYHRARGGGVASYSFSDLTHWPIQYRAGQAPPSKSGLWVYHPCWYRNAVDGPAYDFVLVGGRRDLFTDAPSGPAWRVRRQVGGYTLYERDDAATWNGPDGGPCR